MANFRFTHGFRWCLCLVAVLLALAVASEASIFKLKVTVQAANIRSKPDLKSAVLKVVTLGALFESDAKQGSWYRVSLPPDAQGNPVFGYIHESLIEVVQEIKDEAQAQEAAEPAKAKVAAGRAEKEPKPAPTPTPRPAGAGGAVIIRPFSKVGLLLTPPTATDLDYMEVDGGSLEEFLDVSTFNFGGGVQCLFSLNPQRTVNVGLDLTFQKIFSSVFDTSFTGTVDQHKDADYSFSLMALGEFKPQGSPMILQAGVGSHLVLWSYSYDYSSKYQEIHETHSGTEINLGFLVGGGVDVPITDKISLPIMLRSDIVLRYGVLFNVSASIGLSIH